MSLLQIRFTQQTIWGPGLSCPFCLSPFLSLCQFVQFPLLRTLHEGLPTRGLNFLLLTPEMLVAARILGDLKIMYRTSSEFHKQEKKCQRPQFSH